MAENNPPDSEKVEISVSEHDEYRKAKLIEEVKDEIIKWFKNRTIVIAIAISLIGFIGANVLVATVVRGLLDKDIKEAQKASYLAQDTAERAKKDIEGVIATAKSYNKQILQFDEQLANITSDLDKQLVELALRIKAESDKQLAEQAVRIKAKSDKQLNKQIVKIKTELDKQLDKQAIKIKTNLNSLSSQIEASRRNVNSLSDFSIKKLQEQIENLDKELLRIVETLEPNSTTASEFQVAQTTIREEAQAQKTKLDNNYQFKVYLHYISPKKDIVGRVKGLLVDEGYVVHGRYSFQGSKKEAVVRYHTREGKISVVGSPNRQSNVFRLVKHLEQSLNIEMKKPTFDALRHPYDIYIYLP